MNIHEAARTLRNMYDQAQDKEQVAMIHLFGIIYADEIAHIPKTQLVREAGISPAYHSEVSKGIKLAKYVDLKSRYVSHFNRF